MSRTLNATIDAALDDPFLVPVFFVEMLFDNGAMRLHTDLGTILETVTSPNRTWTGVGTLGRIGPVEETSDATPGRLEVTLSGIDSNVLDEARNQDYQGRALIIYMAVRNAVTGVCSDLVELGYYFMNQMIITTGGEVSSVSVAAESEQSTWENIPVPFFDDQTLQTAHPGDTFFNYLVDLQNVNLRWGDFGGGAVFSNKYYTRPGS